MVRLLDSLGDEWGGGSSGYEDFVARSFEDAALLQTAASREGYRRIFATLAAMVEELHPVPHCLPESPPMSSRSARRLSAQEEAEYDRVVGRLQYRWVAASLTDEGQDARREWIARFRPPGLEQDDEWLTLAGLRELARRVLQLTPVEVSEDELIALFETLDHDDSGYASFFKLVGILEADTPTTSNAALRGPRRRRKKKPRRPKSAGRSVQFTNLPWRNPGPKDKGWQVENASIRTVPIAW